MRFRKRKYWLGKLLFVRCSCATFTYYFMLIKWKKNHFGKNLIREFVGTVSFFSFVLLSMTSESYLYSFAVTLTFHGPKIRAFCANYLRNSKKEETTVHELWSKCIWIYMHFIWSLMRPINGENIANFHLKPLDDKSYSGSLCAFEWVCLYMIFIRIQTMTWCTRL